MAANTRTFSPPASLNQIATVTDFNKLDTNGAESINRNSTASGTRLIPLKPVSLIDPAGGGLGTRMGYESYGTLTTYNVAYDLWIPIDELPHGHVLNTVSFRIDPANGHGGAPAVLPAIYVYTVDSTGANALLGSVTDPYTDVATYEAAHTLTTGALAHTINRAAYTYWVKVILESGANSVNLMVIKSLAATCTIDHALGGTDLSLWV